MMRRPQTRFDFFAVAQFRQRTRGMGKVGVLIEHSGIGKLFAVLLQVVRPGHTGVFCNFLKIREHGVLAHFVADHRTGSAGDGFRIIRHRIGRAGLDMPLVLSGVGAANLAQGRSHPASPRS